MKNTKLSTWAGVCIAYHLAKREEKKNNKCDTFSAGVNFYNERMCKASKWFVFIH